jgi:hypothetical protein
MKAIFYHNDEPLNLEELTGQQIQSLTDYMNSMLLSRKNLWNVDIDIDEEAIITGENQAFKDMYLGKTTQINPQQYGTNPWGLVKVTFVD